MEDDVTVIPVLSTTREAGGSAKEQPECTKSAMMFDSALNLWNRGFPCITWSHSNCNYAVILHARPAAVGDQVPSLRGYRDSLSAENRAIYDAKLSKAPLKLWLAVKTNGTVLTGHWNCMAGLREVGAVLFAVEAGVRMLRAKTCTSVPYQWSVPYAELREIDFTFLNTKKRKLDERISWLTPQSTPVKHRTAYGPSTQQISKFSERLHASGRKPATLALVSVQQRICFQETYSGLLLTKADEVFK